MTRKGYKQTPEHIAKRILRGESHPNFKGDQIVAKSGRTRALRLFPNIGPCSLCGSPKAERHHRDDNTANNDPSNIVILCRKCHMTADGRLARLKSAMDSTQADGVAAAAEMRHQQTHCKRGHLLSGDNLYLRGGSRYCKTCRSIHAKQYQQRKGSAR